MNSILGGAFSSRINLNLRELHGWTYGAGSNFSYRRVPEVGTFTASGAVQSGKTDSSVIEFMRELRGIRDDRTITTEEFDFARGQLTKQVPLQFETVQQRASAIMNLVTNNLPLDYYETLSANIAAVTREQAEATSRTYILPDKLAIVVVGDRKTIEAGLRAAKVAPVVVVDLKGKPVPNRCGQAVPRRGFIPTRRRRHDVVSGAWFRPNVVRCCYSWLLRSADTLSAVSRPIPAKLPVASSSSRPLPPVLPPRIATAPCVSPASSSRATVSTSTVLPHRDRPASPRWTRACRGYRRQPRSERSLWRTGRTGPCSRRRQRLTEDG